MNKIQSFKNAQEFQELFGIQQHNPRLDHSELKQTYEIVKNDLDFWRKEEEYYAKHY